MKNNTNILPYWDLIKRIVEESDVVLEILDARLVELSRNEEVEGIIREVGRPFIFVVNKSDLVKKDNLKKQIKELRNKGNVVFVSTKKKESFRILIGAIKKIFREHGKRKKFDDKPSYREAKADIVVGVLGYPNVGKSSIINLLSHRKKAKVSKKSGTTHGIHWIRATEEIKLIDSPGVFPLSRKSADDEIRYGLIGAKDTERLKNPGLVADAVIKLFQKFNRKAFNSFYGVEIESKSSEEVIEDIGRRKGFLFKAGIVDENRAIDIIVRDWQTGRLRL
jgi:ribosome biogenesis GTPase A